MSDKHNGTDKPEKVELLRLTPKEVAAAFTNSPIGIYIIQENKFTFTNTRFQKITGFSEKELLKKNPLELVIEEDREMVNQYAVQMLKGEREIPYQYRTYHKSGDLRWISETVTPILFNNKKAALGNFMDITESQRFKRSFTISPIGIYTIQDNKFSFTNAKFQEITGYSGKDLGTIKPNELIYPEDRESVRENAIKMLKGQLKEPYYFRIINKDGVVRWVMETVAPIHHEDERAVIGNYIDITESKEIEEALRVSEMKYRSLFELAREGIVIVRYKDGTILDFNKEFQNQLDAPPENIRMKKIWETQPIEFKDEAKKTFYRFRESCGGIVSWRLFQRKEGNILPVEIIAQQMVMNDEKVIFCMVRDTSEREAMMRALSLASEEWRKSFDAIDDAVLLISPDFRIHRANLAASKLLGMDIKKIAGERCHKLFHGTDAPPPYCPHLRAQDQGIYCEEEQEEPYLDRILHFSSSPIKDDEGEVTHTVEIISDVTSSRENEQESIRLSKALASSFQGITEALSDLAESRDPYTAGHSKHVAELAVLAGREIGLTGEELQGLRVCATLHDIGKATVPAAILNKPGKLSEHEWGLIKTHPDKAYETLQHIPFPWPVADIVRQHHEYLDGSGYPKGLKNDKIHPWAKIIAVADVVDAMTSHRPYRPGLPRQQAIDELVKGKNTLYDPKAIEALIRVMLLEDKRVMIIDEDSVILDSLMAELSAEGLESIGYPDSHLAVTAFSRKPYPLVITELNMPGMDGLQVSKNIKELNPVTEVIIITKSGGKEEALRAMRAGASDFLEKPLDLEILRKSVNRALQRFSGRLM